LLIRPGNTKLGEVPCFSILALETCPGATEACQAHCYARKQFFKIPSVKRAHRRNWEATEEPGFPRQMIDEIKQAELELLRVHVAGDFYDVGYVRKWIKIAESCPEVSFYAYTRSWTKQRMLPSLIGLSLLDNFQLWWSCDKDTHVDDGPPPEVDGIKVAYMQSEQGEPIPTYTDLVFRVKRDTIEMSIAGHRVCPAENGIKPKRPCSECRLCWSQRATQRAGRKRQTAVFAHQ